MRIDIIPQKTLGSDGMVKTYGIKINGQPQYWFVESEFYAFLNALGLTYTGGNTLWI